MGEAALNVGSWMPARSAVLEMLHQQQVWNNSNVSKVDEESSPPVVDLKSFLDEYTHSKPFNTVIELLRSASAVIRNSLHSYEVDEPMTTDQRRLSAKTRRNSQYKEKADIVIYDISDIGTTQSPGRWSFEGRTTIPVRPPHEPFRSRLSAARRNDGLQTEASSNCSGVAGGMALRGRRIIPSITRKLKVRTWTYEQVKFLDDYGDQLIEYFYNLYHVTRKSIKPPASSGGSSGAANNVSDDARAASEVRNRTARIVTKLCLYILRELDLPRVIRYAYSKVMTSYNAYTMRAFIDEFIPILLKDAPRPERDMRLEHLNGLQINKMFPESLQVLYAFVCQRYYRIVDLPQEDASVNANEKNFDKHFYKIARNIQRIHCYTSSTELQLKIATMDVTYKGRAKHVTAVTFLGESSKTYIFDVLGTPSCPIEEWKKYSWYERLKLLDVAIESGDLVLPVKYPRITNDLHLIKLVNLQFGRFANQCTNTYIYIRTVGLGTGTLFVRQNIVETEDQRSIDGGSSSTLTGGVKRKVTKSGKTKRRQKVRDEDLKEKTIKEVSESLPLPFYLDPPPYEEFARIQVEAASCNVAQSVYSAIAVDNVTGIVKFEIEENDDATAAYDDRRKTNPSGKKRKSPNSAGTGISTKKHPRIITSI